MVVRLKRVEFGVQGSTLRSHKIPPNLGQTEDSLDQKQGNRGRKEEVLSESDRCAETSVIEIREKGGKSESY